MDSFWDGKSVLVTGHTGFKGTWLCLLLESLGANVSGFSLFEEGNPRYALWSEVSKDLSVLSKIGDINEVAAFRSFVGEVQPEIVFHLAAQPIVSEGYLDPIGTVRDNVLGTTSVLFNALKSERLNAVVNVTTDKVYKNKEWIWPYRETDALGGSDPYSASKSCAEIVSKSIKLSYYIPKCIPLVAVRAGNVIGGGDFAVDRLIPDIARSVIRDGGTLKVRCLEATRPWQHVLDPLWGYLMLARYLVRNNDYEIEALNFSPNDPDRLSVRDVIGVAERTLGKKIMIEETSGSFKESRLLQLDSSMARDMLGWQPLMSSVEAIESSVQWYKQHYEGAKAIDLMTDELNIVLEREM